MEHNAPHKSALFEGYYSKFDLPAGGHVALILCEVRGAKQRPYMVSFTYVPPGNEPVFQRELWVDEMTVTSGPDHTFTIDVGAIGHVAWGPNSKVEYNLHHKDFTFRGSTTSDTPWSKTCDTPEGLLVRLPLPLHWHVQTLGSKCPYFLTIPSTTIPPAERQGTAVVHQEKNWAHSFPAAHIWIQARRGDPSDPTSSTFCCAGGRILGTEAFLLGYRGGDNETSRGAPLSLDFTPPTALALAPFGTTWWSPGLHFTRDWEGTDADAEGGARGVTLAVQGWTRRIRVVARAPRGTFFALSSPFPEGHRTNMLAQSFRATLDVVVEEWCAGSGWLGWLGVEGAWRVVREERFEGASLEFGGEYYPPAGSDVRTH